LPRAASRNDSCICGRAEVTTMNNIFYIIGVIVVIVAILGFLGLR
jgi:hypothetical protein